ncbi:MAG: acyltransferase [Lactobacillus sp.]|jgi:acetyltransferase-like isoleucine patch superfamily enzyme|nr:acyltransferase [Lactobacillus sp.]
MKFLINLVPSKKLRKKLKERYGKKFDAYDNKYTRKIYSKAKECGKNLFVGRPSRINDNAYLGDNVNFNGMDIYGKGKVTIGDYFHSGLGCTMITDNHNYEGEKIPYDETYTSKDIEIGKCVWFGFNVTILPGTKIGDGAIIQAGSVVHGEIPKYAIAGGNPAKVFSYRDKKHYDKLEKQGKFY